METKLPDDVRARVIARLKEATAGHGNARKFARKHDIAEGYLSDVLRARRPPGPSIMRALGLAVDLREAPSE